MTESHFAIGHVRLGPLEVEQKKRKAGKRQRFEKNKEDEVAPQEVCALLSSQHSPQMADLDASMCVSPHS